MLHFCPPKNKSAIENSVSDRLTWVVTGRGLGADQSFRFVKNVGEKVSFVKRFAFSYNRSVNQSYNRCSRNWYLKDNTLRHITYRGSCAGKFFTTIQRAFIYEHNNCVVRSLLFWLYVRRILFLLLLVLMLGNTTMASRNCFHNKQLLRKQI